MGEVIEYVLRVSGEQAAQSLGAVANEAQRTKAALDATSRLEILSARGGSEVERAALAYRNLAIEIRGLVDAGGDAAMATRVMERAQAELAATVARSNAVIGTQSQAIRSSAVVLDNANISTGAYKAGLFSLGQQLMDVGAMAASGANPLTILALQGPQIATAAAQVGGFGAAVKGIAGYLVTLAPLLAGATVAVAALGTAYAVVGNATMTAESEARDHNEALVAQALAASKTAEEVDKLTRSWASYTDKADEIQRQMGVINGTLDESAAAAERAGNAIRGAAEANVRAMADEVAQLRVALTAAEGMAGNADLPAADRATASGQAVQIRERLAAASAQLAATREQVAADADAAGMVAEYGVRTREAAEAERERAAAIRAAAEAARAAEEVWNRYFASVKRAGEIATAMAAADRALAASRAGTDQAAQWALYGQQLEAVARIAAEAEAERMDGHAEEQARLVGLVSAMNDYADATNNATAARSGLSAAANAAEMAQGGPQAVMGGVSNAGPWGAIIAAIVGLAKDFQNIGDLFHNFTVDFNNSIANFGATLGDNIGRWFEEGTRSAIDMSTGLIQGLADNMGSILEGIFGTIAELIPDLLSHLFVELPNVAVELVTQMVDLDMWYEVGAKMVEGFMEGFTVGKFAGDGGKVTAGSFFGGLGDIITGGLSGNIVETAQTGKLTGGDGPDYGRRNTGRNLGTSVHFHAPVIGLGADGAQTLSTEMVARNYMRTPG